MQVTAARSTLASVMPLLQPRSKTGELVDEMMEQLEFFADHASAGELRALSQVQRLNDEKVLLRMHSQLQERYTRIALATAIEEAADIDALALPAGPATVPLESRRTQASDQ